MSTFLCSQLPLGSEVVVEELSKGFSAEEQGGRSQAKRRKRCVFSSLQPWQLCCTAAVQCMARQSRQAAQTCTLGHSQKLFCITEQHHDNTHMHAYTNTYVCMYVCTYLLKCLLVCTWVRVYVTDTWVLSRNAFTCALKPVSTWCLTVLCAC